MVFSVKLRSSFKYRLYFFNTAKIYNLQLKFSAKLRIKGKNKKDFLPFLSKKCNFAL